MLDSANLCGFLMTSDYDRAKEFFCGKLGFQFESLDPFALAVRVGGHQIRITRLPDFKPLPATVLGWEVKDIEAAVDWLSSRGIATEKYPWVQDQQRGIWAAPGGAKVAWFKDPDGNVLSVAQHGS